MSIRRAFSVATGPGIFRRGLIAQTQGVRTMLRAAEGIDLLRTPLPPAVFGGALVELLSDQLQQVLRGQGAGPASPEGVAPTREDSPAFAPPETGGPRRAPAGEPASAGTSARWSFGPEAMAATGRAGEGEGSAGNPPSGPGQPVRAWTEPTAPPRTNRDWLPAAGAPARSPLAGSESSPPARESRRRSRSRGPAHVLVKLVEEYLAGRPPAAATRRRPAGQLEGGRATGIASPPPPAPDPGAPPGGLGAQPSRLMTQQEISDGLRSFVAGMNPAEPTSAAPAFPDRLPAPRGRAPSSSPAGPVSTPPSAIAEDEEAESMRELADQLAAILRDQALDHGIDLS